MSTTDTVLLYILTIILSIFFLVGIVVLIALLRLIVAIKRAVARAEDVIDSVESAAEVLRDTEGRLALFKLVRNIVKMTKKRRNRSK
jgi:uncharacterized membrane protein